MSHRRRKGRQFIHMHLYNYYIILLTWAISCIFIITSGLCEVGKQQQQNHDQQHQSDGGGGQAKDKIQQIVREHMLKLFNIKDVPKAPTNRAYVPVEMLREYLKYRDEVREYIPDDRDFLGKIDLDDLHPNDNNDFWREFKNRHSNGIEINLGPKEGDKTDKTSRKFYSVGDVTQISAIPPQSDPEQVDPKLEPILPPHIRGHFASFHIKFNLSQDELQDPYESKNLRGATLKLNRDKLLDCRGDNCDIIQTADQPSPYDNKTEEKLNVAIGHRRHVPRKQRCFLTRVNGYTKEGTPITNIITSSILDTQQDTPINFDISRIVRDWLEDPAKNLGLIIRVTNDDKEYEDLMKQSNKLTNALTNSTYGRDLNLDHVRLKRSFMHKSDAEDSWLRKRPSLTLYFADKADRHNVKRADEPDSDMEGAQADAPNPISDSSGQEETTASTPSNSQSANKSIAKSTASNQRLTLTTNRPKSQPTGRNPSSRNTAPTTKRPTSNKQNHKSEKCKVMPMTVNFDEVGWSSWIIAPANFISNFCAGDCSFPLADHQNSTNHAIIQGIFHSVGRNIPRTCCAPVKLGKMAILFQLDHSVQLKYYDDMIVESCGCL